MRSLYKQNEIKLVPGSMARGLNQLKVVSHMPPGQTVLDPYRTAGLCPKQRQNIQNYI